MKTAEMTLMERFATTAPQFQESIRDIASRGGTTVEHVYTLWRDYSKRCEWSDQSALLGEFQEWYAKDLNIERRYDI